MSDTCAYTVLDEDGIEQPCDRPATGHRWYQDVEHEDLLDVACDLHANEGGRRMAAVIAIAERWQREAAERGPYDEIYTDGAAALVLHAIRGDQ